MLPFIARRPGAGPFPVVLVLHGTHGFAWQYVQLAQDLARGGFLAVAGCWFSGAENPNNPRGTPGREAGANVVSPPIPFPEVPPLRPGAYEEGLQYIDGLVQATRALPGARPHRLALVGHSRGGGGKLAIHTGDRQRAGRHSS